MKAIILVGGFGTRLRPLTLNTPKALLPVLNKPFISYQLDLLRKGGVREIAFAAGHLSNTLSRFVKPLSKSGIKFHFAHEKEPLGTGGAIRFAYDKGFKLGKNPKEPVIIFNGDVFLSLDVRAFLRHHLKQKADVSIALTQVSDASRFGVIKTKGKGEKIQKFLEKPKGIRGPQWINAGAYIFNTNRILDIPLGHPISVEREIFPKFLKSNRSLHGFRMFGYWNDIGTPQTYLQAHSDLIAKRNPFTPQKYFRKRGVLVGSNVKISKQADFQGFVCLGANVKIGEGARVADSVILDGTQIGPGANISGAIIGRNANIGAFANITPGSVIGDRSQLTEFTKT